jgi:hypothetical protein
MKALVVRQPWAWLIVHGVKDVENRTWPTPYRGPILIVAGTSTEDLQFIAEAQESAARVALPAEFDRGGIVGCVTITGMSSPCEHPSDWAIGPWCWDLADARPLPFVPYRGRQGLFDLPGDTVEEALERLGAGS